MSLLERSFIVVSAILCLFLVTLGQSFLAHNFYNDADSSFFLYGGKILLEGKTLYIDYWDQKPPAIFIQNALFIALFGYNFTTYAVLHAIAYFCALLHLLKSINTIYPKAYLAWLAIVLSYGFHLYHYIDFGNRTEFGIALFECFAISFLIRYLYSSSWVSLFFAGSMSAIAFLYKPVGMASFLAFLTLTLIHPQINWRKKLKEFIVLSSGFLSPILFVSLWLLSQGTLEQAFSATFLVPIQSSQNSHDLLSAFQASVYKLGPLWGLAFPLVLLPFYFFKREKLSSNECLCLVLLCLWLLASLSGVVLQRYARPHYQHQLVVPLILSSFWILATLSKTMGPLSKKFVWLLYICCALFFSRFPLIQQWNQYQQFSKESAFTLELKQLSSYLQQHLQSDETFYYWSMGYMPYILTNRNAPGSYSPVFLTHNPATSKHIEKDLISVFNNPKVRFLIETPQHPLFNQVTFEQLPKDQHAFEVLQHYQKSRDQDFTPLELDFKYFKLFKRIHEPPKGI